MTNTSLRHTDSGARPFIVFEGLDNSGKSTQIQLLSQWLTQQNIPHLTLREPGSTPVGEQIRALLKTEHMTDQARLLLFNACRNMLLEHISHYPNHWILCDRYKQSTWAYQHYGKGLSAHLLETLDNIHEHNRNPDLIIYLESGASQTLAPRDELEKISIDRVRQGYETMMAQANASATDSVHAHSAHTSTASIHTTWLKIPHTSIEETAQIIQNYISKHLLHHIKY